MATFDLRAKVWSSASKLPDQLEKVAQALRDDGWRVGGYAVGSTDWYRTHYPFVMRGISKPGATEAQARAAVSKAAGSFFNAWKDVAFEFGSEVVVKTAADAADVAKRTAQTVERASFGIGAGLGVALGVAAVLFLLVKLK